MCARPPSSVPPPPPSESAGCGTGRDHCPHPTPPLFTDGDGATSAPTRLGGGTRPRKYSCVKPVPQPTQTRERGVCGESGRVAGWPGVTSDLVI